MSPLLASWRYSCSDKEWTMNTFNMDSWWKTMIGMVGKIFILVIIVHMFPIDLLSFVCFFIIVMWEGGRWTWSTISSGPLVTKTQFLISWVHFLLPICLIVSRLAFAFHYLFIIYSRLFSQLGAVPSGQWMRWYICNIHLSVRSLLMQHKLLCMKTNLLATWRHIKTSTNM